MGIRMLVRKREQLLTKWCLVQGCVINFCLVTVLTYFKYREVAFINTLLDIRSKINRNSKPPPIPGIFTPAKWLPYQILVNKPVENV